MILHGINLIDYYMKSKIIILAILFSLNIFAQSNLTNYLVGGSNDEYTYDHCFDSNGNFIIIGIVRGMDMFFTDTIGTPDNSNKNIFIRKYSSDLSTLISSTVICGSGNDYCKSVDIDSQGNVFIAGHVYSSDPPTTPNAYQTTNNSPSSYEAYIVKLNPDLNQLLSATYFGGEDKDYIYKMRIDQNDNIIAVGSTRSTTNIATIGAYDESYGGSDETIYHFGDAYIVKFDNNLENKLAATYLGDEGDEACFALSVNSDNNIVITGASTSSNYPVSANAFQTVKNASYDIVLTELNSDLTQVLHSTFVGGNGDDIAWDIAYNYTDQKYIIGVQTSSSFTISGSVADATVNGGGDGMIIILNNDLENIHSATYVGGSDVDFVSSVYYLNNAIYYCGITESADLPTSSDAYYSNFLDENGYADGFYGSIDTDLSEFEHLSYFGGNNDDLLWRVSSYNNKIYVNGNTMSSNIESDSTLKGTSDAIFGVVENIYTNIGREDYNILTGNSISIYPNPTTGVINIMGINNFEKLQIFDLQGKLVKTYSSFTNQIDINNLTSGNYTIKIISEDSVITKKLVLID